MRQSSSTPSPSNRDVTRIAASRGISMAGAEAGYIALLALAWQLTGSPARASLVLLASVAARTVGAPLAGWIGDHVDRRRVVVASELAAAVAFGSLAWASSMWHVLAAMVCGTFAAMCGGAALDAAIPNLVQPSDLARANATLGMARTAGHMLGPVLGGLAVAALGARSAFLLDGVSSIVAAAFLIGITGSLGGVTATNAAAGDDPADAAPTAPPRRGMLVGLEHMAGDPALRLLALGWAGMCVCFAFVSAAELPLSVSFGVDELGLGMIVTTWCAGSLLGAWFARRVQVAERGARVLVGNALLCGAVFVATGVAPWFAGVLALMFVGGASMALAEVVESTIVQTRIEDDIRARVLAAFGGLMSAVFGVNLALAGFVVELTSPGTAYVYAGAWCLIGAAGFWLFARQLDDELYNYTMRLIRPRHALESELAEGA